MATLFVVAGCRLRPARAEGTIAAPSNRPGPVVVAALAVRLLLRVAACPVAVTTLTVLTLTCAVGQLANPLFGRPVSCAGRCDGRYPIPAAGRFVAEVSCSP